MSDTWTVNLQDLCGGDGLAGALGGTLGNFLDFRATDDEGEANGVVTKALGHMLAFSWCVRIIGGTAYRVGSDVDALLVGVLDQRRVGQVRVALDLKGGRDNTGSVDDSFEL